MNIPTEVTRKVMTAYVSPEEQRLPIPPSVTNGFSAIGESSPGTPLNGGRYLNNEDVAMILSGCDEAWEAILKNKARSREYA